MSVFVFVLFCVVLLFFCCCFFFLGGRRDGNSHIIQYINILIYLFVCLFLHNHEIVISCMVEPHSTDVFDIGLSCNSHNVMGLLRYDSKVLFFRLFVVLFVCLFASFILFLLLLFIIIIIIYLFIYLFIFLFVVVFWGTLFLAASIWLVDMSFKHNVMRSSLYVGWTYRWIWF